MKKNLFLLYALIIVSFFACKEKKNIDNIKSEKENAVVFIIDERTEFFRTAFNLAFQNDLPEDLQSCETDYLKRVNDKFIPHKEHPFIDWIYNSENIGIDFSTIGLMLEDFEEFKFDKTYTDELKKYGINEKTLDSIKPIIKDFYHKSEFGEFFKNNEEYYSKAILKLKNQVSNENLFDKVLEFYQSNEKGLELTVFVELTNNANSKAVSFYDKYNPKKRAFILANICDLPTKPTKVNDFMELDDNIRGLFYHETSHLFTNKLLEENIGELSQYNAICENCSDIQIKDKIDHLIVFPLQGLMVYRFHNVKGAHDFYLTACTDIRKNIYERLSKYLPEDKIPFEKTYIDCINLIKELALDK